jgi:hypothetical protein
MPDANGPLDPNRDREGAATSCLPGEGPLASTGWRPWLRSFAPNGAGGLIAASRFHGRRGAGPGPRSVTPPGPKSSPPKLSRTPASLKPGAALYIRPHPA